MDLAPDRAELALDRRVDVLVVRADHAAGGDAVERRLDRRQLLAREQAGRGEPPRVNSARPAVVGEQLGVIRLQERPDAPSSPSPCARPRRSRHDRTMVLPRRGELRLEPEQLDEALGRRVRERLAGRIRRERLRVQRVRTAGR